MVGEDMIGAPAVEAIYGHDLATGEAIPGNLFDGGERSQKLASGVAGFAGTAAGLAALLVPKPPPVAPSSGVVNPLPSTFARVVPGNVNPTALGITDQVFVTDAAALLRLNASEIAVGLEIPQAVSFKIIAFGSDGVQGIATPIRSTAPGFTGGDITSGGLPEFVIPNGPIPPGAVIRTVP